MTASSVRHTNLDQAGLIAPPPTNQLGLIGGDFGGLLRIMSGCQEEVAISLTFISIRCYPFLQQNGMGFTLFAQEDTIQ